MVLPVNCIGIWSRMAPWLQIVGRTSGAFLDVYFPVYDKYVLEWNLLVFCTKDHSCQYGIRRMDGPWSFGHASVGDLLFRRFSLHLSFAMCLACSGGCRGIGTDISEIANPTPSTSSAFCFQCVPGSWTSQAAGRILLCSMDDSQSQHKCLPDTHASCFLWIFVSLILWFFEIFVLFDWL